MQLILPIYWEQEFVTKNNRFHLVGLNQLFGMHYQVRNKLKQHFHSLVLAHENLTPILTSYTVEYKLYYKNVKSDPGNIIAGIEKVLLDGLQEAKLITEDNPNYHLGTTWSVVGQDKLNPRVEITLKEQPNEL